MTSFWNERFSSQEYIYGVAPNRFFARRLQLIKAGKLLLPMEGEGRNAVHAALQGWKVHAFDSSSEGIKKAKQLAEISGVKIDYSNASANAFTCLPHSFDAVALVFAHLPPDDRRVMHKYIGEAVKPGGHLIAEVFHPHQLGRNSGGPSREEMLYTLNMLEEDFLDFKTIFGKEEAVELDEGQYHQGKAYVTRYVSQKHD